VVVAVVEVAAAVVAVAARHLLHHVLDDLDRALELVEGRDGLLEHHLYGGAPLGFLDDGRHLRGDGGGAVMSGWRWVVSGEW